MTRTRRTSSSVPRGEPAQGRRLRGRCGELCAPSQPHPTQCPHLPASGCARGRRKPAPRCWGSRAPRSSLPLFRPSPIPARPSLFQTGALGDPRPIGSAARPAPQPGSVQTPPPTLPQSPKPTATNCQPQNNPAPGRLSRCSRLPSCAVPHCSRLSQGAPPPEAMPSSAGDPCRAPPAGKLACAPEHRRRPAGSQRPRSTPSSLCPRAGSDLPATGIYLPKPHNPAPYADLVVGHSKGASIYGAVNSASAEDGGSERGSCSTRPGPAQAPRDTAVHHCARSRTRQRVVKAT